MAEEMGERTEEPSARKLFDARERGQIAKSNDLSSAFTLLGALALLWLLGPPMFNALGALMHRGLANELPGAPFDATAAIPSLTMSLTEGVMASWPIIIVMFLVVYLAHLQQVGFLITTKPLEPKLDRMNPLQGAKRLVDRKNAIKSAMMIAKLAVVITVTVIIVRSHIPELAGLPNLPALAGAGAIAGMVLELALWLVVLLIAMGFADWGFQRWQHKQELRMTKQEVKDERRSMEGDEEIKARRRGIARQMAQQRIRSAVPKANVVVTNPTHFAVALQYDSASMAAPRVVAKGADWLAFQIRSIATVSGVPIVEKPELARALYAAVPVGREVPGQFYQAVAEILAYVYRLEGKAQEAQERLQRDLADQPDDQAPVVMNSPPR